MEQPLTGGGRSEGRAGEEVEGLGDRVLLRGVSGLGLVGLLLLAGCQFLPPELRTLKSPIRFTPFKHEVTVQPARGMGTAPFTIDRAKAEWAEVQLTVTNPTTSAIRVVWAEGTFITAESIPHAIGVKNDRDGLSTEPTIIEANSTIRITVMAITKDGKPIASGSKSIEAPYRVGLKLTAERGLTRWKGTVWVFVL
jgi:beta-lactamase regulating signal transducer with metallopeptidase domain